MRQIRSCLFLVFVLCLPLFAQQADPSLVTLDRVFESGDFNPQGPGQVRWLRSGNAYSRLERVTNGKGSDLVPVDAATGNKTVLIPASKFIPAASPEPLQVQNYDWSSDNNKLLVYTNSKKVWRLNTRGDYWVLDQQSGKLTKLGGDAKPSTLMFATFSPDGTRVGYVRENNIYVENLSNNQIAKLTNDGSVTIINGTFDWVYEEELDLRDGWRWSPDGNHIAYWQLDASGVRDFYLIDNTRSLYPTIIPVQYPKAGEQNSASRVGVVSAQGGATRWMDV